MCLCVLRYTCVNFNRTESIWWVFIRWQRWRHTGGPAPLPVCCYLIHFREKETDVPECYPLSGEFHHAEFLRWNLGVGKRDGEHIAASIRVILQMTCVRPVMPAVQCQTSFSLTLEEKKKTFFFLSSNTDRIFSNCCPSPYNNNIPLSFFIIQFR